MTDILLSASRITKSYMTAQTRVDAIRQISLQVQVGEFLCLVGPSGSGKSTLLRILAGLLQPDEGQVDFRGVSLTGPSAEMALVFQKANLMPWRQVIDNVRLPLEVQKMPAAEAEHRARELLTLVGLAEFAASYPHELSGGMQQRVAIARALVSDPAILLLDEPFGALDAFTREHLNQELLHIWQQQGKTVVMVTHDIGEAVYLADRVLVLSPRPGTVAATIPISLPRPRQPAMRFEADFNALAFQVRQAIG